MANTTDILTDIIFQQPECAQRCWLGAIDSGTCDVKYLKPFADCICTNIPLLASISTCVQKSCIWTDQTIQRHTQLDLCVAYPKESKKAEMITLAGAGMTLATVVVGLRCYSRMVSVRELWWDDWTAVISLVLLLAMGSVGMIGTNMGFGLHYWDTEPRFTMKIRQIFWAVEIGYLLNITLLKVSIMLLFTRIFQTRWWYRMNQVILVFFAVKVFAFLFPLIFQCMPLEAVWDPSIDGKCLSIAAIGFAGAGLSISEDLFFLVLPIPTLWTLQLDLQKRVWLIVLFGIGSFACITSFIRIKALMTFARTDDLTWDNVDVVEWTGIELVSALICGSIPPCWSQVGRLSSYTRLKLGLLYESLRPRKLSSLDSSEDMNPNMQQK